MSKTKTHNRTIMASEVAKRWISKNLKSEYRLTLYAGASSRVRNASGLLRGFRDGRLKIGKVSPIPDMGIKDFMDRIEIWSSNKKAMMEIKGWFEERGFETSGLW